MQYGDKITLQYKLKKIQSKMKAQLIEKEQVASLHFPENNTRTENEFNSQLRVKLNRATSLGNLFHVKSIIQFLDDEGLKEVRTTIWATGDRYIVLKKGVIIPINRILDVIS